MIFLLKFYLFSLFIIKTENSKKNKIKEKNFLEHKLSKYLPKILEVNLIAKEVKKKKNMKFIILLKINSIFKSIFNYLKFILFFYSSKEMSLCNQNLNTNIKI
jgi:hypothetical protein